MLMDDILKSVKMEDGEYYIKTIVSLYILRNDFMDNIKNMAINTWKANIYNSPKTVKKNLKAMIY